MKDFDDDFFFHLQKEEIATVFSESKIHANEILKSGACSRLAEEDARVMALSLAVTAAMLRRYDTTTNESK